MLQDFAHQPKAPDRPLQVIRFGQKVRVYQRGSVRVLAGQPDAAPAQGAQHAQMAGNAVAQHQSAGVVDELGHHEVQLQIGSVFAVGTFDKATGLGRVAGQHAGAMLAPLENGFQGLERRTRRDAYGILELWCIQHQHHIEVVLQVTPDAGQVVQGRDAQRLQIGLWTDA